MRDNKTKRFHCNVIYIYRIIQDNHLKQHVASGYGKANYFEGTQCDYVAYKNGQLKKHMTSVQNKDTRFHCGQLKYAVSRKSHLKHHMASVYTIAKHFQGTQCDYI